MSAIALSGLGRIVVMATMRGVRQLWAAAMRRSVNGR